MKGPPNDYVLHETDTSDQIVLRRYHSILLWHTWLANTRQDQTTNTEPETFPIAMSGRDVTFVPRGGAPEGGDAVGLFVSVGARAFPPPPHPPGASVKNKVALNFDSCNQSRMLKLVCFSRRQIYLSKKNQTNGCCCVVRCWKYRLLGAFVKEIPPFPTPPSIAPKAPAQIGPRLHS